MRTITIILFFISFHSKAQICQGVTVTVDKFNKTTTKKTSILNPLAVYAYISEKDTSYWLAVTYKSSSISLDEESKGVIILFTDDVRIQRPYLDIKQEYQGKYIIYNCLFRLDSYDINVLKTKNVTDLKISGIQTEISPSSANKMRTVFDCLIK